MISITYTVRKTKMNTQNITINGRNFQVTLVANSLAPVEIQQNGTKKLFGFCLKRGTEWINNSDRKIMDADVIQALEQAKKAL